ncbi:MAG: outer membrane protein assembly factor BamC [Moraxellaceae bacterium]
MRKLSHLFCMSLVLATAGCSTYFRDRASDYRSAKDMPPLQLAPGQETRAIKPLYPIPPGPEVTIKSSKKFEAPKPKPLAVLPEAPAAPEKALTPAQMPVLTQDGNGYPVVSIEGDFNAIWDRLDESLRTGSVKVDDRDQRVGLYYLTLADAEGKKNPYQLRITRGQSAYTLTLQKDDDTLAPQATTKTLFESIVSHWPKDSGDMNGKARPAVHR